MPKGLVNIRKGEDQVHKDKGIELLTLSLDYSELNMVKYDGIGQQIIFEIAIQDSEIELLENFLSKLDQSFKVYYKINKINPIVIKTTIKVNQDIAFIRLYRDIKTINKAELDLFIHMVRNYLEGFLIIDECQVATPINKNLLKKNLIDCFATGLGNNSSYLVYRQHGKVVVHNK